MSTLAVLGSSPLPPAGEAGGARAGYGVSLADLGGFEQALQRAQQRPGTTSTQGIQSPQGIQPTTQPSQAVAQIFKPFEYINAEATSLGRMAEMARAAGPEMSPGEVVQLTLRCQEFMFHCQLTSNIANRGADGLQQLFRQQG